MIEDMESKMRGQLQVSLAARESQASGPRDG
jgi:hypothetical protein